MGTKPKRIVKQVTCQKCGKVMYPNWVTRHVCGESESYVRKYTPKPKLVMICPNGWKNCPDCANEKLCITGLYKPEPSDIDIVVLAAKIAEEVVTKDAIESAHKIRGTWMEELDQVTTAEEFWAWFNKGKRPGDINYKEPLPAGPSKPGGGSKSRAPKKPKKEIPEYMKILGM